MRARRCSVTSGTFALTLPPRHLPLSIMIIGRCGMQFRPANSCRASMPSCHGSICDMPRFRTSMCDAIERRLGRRRIGERYDVSDEQLPHVAKPQPGADGQLDAGLSAISDPLLDPLFWSAERLGAPSAWWLHVPFAHWIVCA